jgi:hypothetical protein
MTSTAKPVSSRIRDFFRNDVSQFFGYRSEYVKAALQTVTEEEREAYRQAEMANHFSAGIVFGGTVFGVPGPAATFAALMYGVKRLAPTPGTIAYRKVRAIARDIRESGQTPDEYLSSLAWRRSAERTVKPAAPTKP